MNQIQIQGTQIQIKEYNGQRVITFKDIDTVHKRPDGTARKRFADNRKRFIESVDFYRVSKEEIQLSEKRTVENVSNNGITLITESGYLMLVKSFTDDLAWKVQRELVDSYFRVRDCPVIDSDTQVINTDKLIKCAEIMAGCLEGNRPYVLNILRHIVPNIEEQGPLPKTVEVKTYDEIMNVPDVTEKVIVNGDDGSYKVPFNHNQFDNYLITNYITSTWLAKESGVGINCVTRYRYGQSKPTMRNRKKICDVLGLPADYFDNSRRVRRISQSR